RQRQMCIRDRAQMRGLPEERVRFMAMPFEDVATEEEFDAVIGSSVLHHLQVEEAVRRIFSLLKPGGIMVFAEPNMLNPQALVQKNLPPLKTLMGDSRDETAFFPWKIHRLLRETGFDVVEVYPFDWLHPLTPRYLIAVIGALGECCERMPVIRYFSGSLLISGRKPQDTVV
ncbi:MAG: methyltransferase domain-containing protein, partial [Syntrophales bacterium]|nr:methyltransferase domain-containing protein [Syntrophales bacterium]